MVIAQKKKARNGEGGEVGGREKKRAGPMRDSEKNRGPAERQRRAFQKKNPRPKKKKGASALTIDSQKRGGLQYWERGAT